MNKSWGRRKRQIISSRGIRTERQQEEMEAFVKVGRGAGRKGTSGSFHRRPPRKEREVLD